MNFINIWSHKTDSCVPNIVSAKGLEHTCDVKTNDSGI